MTVLVGMRKQVQQQVPFRNDRQKRKATADTQADSPEGNDRKKGKDNDSRSFVFPTLPTSGRMGHPATAGSLQE
jgi:hypothetical protein